MNYLRTAFHRWHCYGPAFAMLVGLSACDNPPAGGGTTKPAEPPSWAKERALREKQQVDYLGDTAIRSIATDTPDRVPWYSSQLGYYWFTSSPLGVNGIPFVVLRTVIELYPEIWAGEGSLGNLGFGPHPDDYDPTTGKLLPAEQRHVLPFGLFTTTDPSVAEDRQTDNVFFSCAACHTGRVYVKDRVRHIVGAPNTEIEAQAYASLLYRTKQAIVKDGAPDAAQVQRIAGFVKTKIASDPAWFYGGRTPEERSRGAERAKLQVARILGNLPWAIGTVIGSGQKTETLYLALAQKLSYTDLPDQAAPGIFGPRPGRMDAFGIAAGLVVLHAGGVAKGYVPVHDSFLARLPDDHPFFAGIEGLPQDEKVKRAGERLAATAPEWMPHQPGPSDIKALWLSREHGAANWDANQGAKSRVIASGTSAVGDPAKVDVRIHEAMNPFIDDLPPTPYPFDVDMGLAEKGKPLFEENCAAKCHRPNNGKVYDIGTDMNRARQISPTARLGLLELTRDACELYVVKGHADWCRPKAGSRAADDESYFVTPRAKPGYKADTLHGIWAQAPYLHNGSVPTLWHLFRPKERPAKFIRGNIRYDEAKVGFVWDRAPTANEYGPGDAVHFAEHDTTLRGNANTGHTFGSDWTDEQVRAVLEYLKTR